MQRRERPTLLVLGANGQLGFELRRSLACLGEVVALDRSGCDIAEPDRCRAVLAQHRPSVVVNAAAYTDVEQAERDRDAAFLINAAAPGWLSEAARDAGALFVHYSTDFVFEGRSGRPYTEADVPAPLSVYGATKLEGERAVMAAGGPALVLRTAWLAGLHGTNFLKTILARALAGDRLRVVTDQIGTPTSAALVADVTAQIVARHWLGGAARAAFPTGLYHVAAGGEVSRHGYACEILRYALACGANLQSGPTDVEPCTAGEVGGKASRPAHAVLNTDRLRETFGLHLPPWEQGVHWLLEQIIWGKSTHA
ncbi:dTDP-4-dehydrorhamnose reductase [Cupriavidus sp. SZY C1]|uniref:dTDP-4-dehydrorhamnose reductase n=1 Tax=Cupriavidus sp. SZY C1 TaxID=3055037 RepID=UPI0028B6CA7B|nr:dTDP-4-dehydrorhamnose reductase [Cupriavidus sp. SZY C1]MDT6960358.1 dTDP-4-dehydrorhamnose reductase [Cupriavidus sp. SZY C1]